MRRTCEGGGCGVGAPTGAERRAANIEDLVVLKGEAVHSPNECDDDRPKRADCLIFVAKNDTVTVLIVELKGKTFSGRAVEQKLRQSCADALAVAHEADLVINVIPAVLAEAWPTAERRHLANQSIGGHNVLTKRCGEPLLRLLRCSS
jgi:hypothetical protein